MRLGRIVAACIVAGACSTAGAAGFSLDLSSGSSGFANTPIAGGFIDTYNFTLVTPSLASGSIISAVLGNQDVDFTSITIIGPSGTSAFSLLNADPFENWAVNNTPLSAGNYSLTLVGVNSSGIGSYGGNFAVTPTSGGASSGGTSSTGPLDLSTGSTGFFNTPVSGSFVDAYTFVATVPFLLNGAITGVSNGVQDVDFTSIVVSGPGGTSNFSPLFADPDEAWVLPVASFGAGAYTLSLSGTNSAGRGSYGGTLAFSSIGSQAVPEPATGALMIIALAALVARRRR